MRAHVAILLSVASLAGCVAKGDACERNEEAPSAECAERDFFALRRTFEADDWTQSTAWQNSRGGAVVEWHGNVTGGHVVLTLLDADGEQVYLGVFDREDVAGTYVEADRGATGKWRVNVTAANATGVFDVVLRASGFPRLG